MTRCVTLKTQRTMAGQDMGARESTRGTMPSACDQCYRCKVRCNGARPACDRCSKAGGSCTYSFGKLGRRTKKQHSRSKSHPQSQRQISASISTIEQPGRPKKSTPTPVTHSDLPTQSQTSSAPITELVHTNNGHAEDDALDVLSYEPNYGDVSADEELWMADSAIDMNMEDVPWLEDPWALDTPKEVQMGEDAAPSLFDLDAVIEFNQPALKGFSDVRDSVSSLSPSDPGQNEISAHRHVDPGDTPPCSCCSFIFEWIPKLHHISKNARISSLDSTLRNARQAVTLIRDYLSCGVCVKRTDHGEDFDAGGVLSSALRLIVQQVVSCYRELDFWCSYERCVGLPITIEEREILESDAKLCVLKAVLSAEKDYVTELSRQLRE
ncbi:hypothetical protein AC579_6771 [Pseudocercospora musae]|uniref:Zn(2)-C6 fungal-type domain-containing protein n=1 Tax=Pseudocercospora musae TaxID=113226 RepID=A0A139I3H9_9PEZI|nr:hypothetical protein AC579_6771 [Pseudocercospora musae]